MKNKKTIILITILFLLGSNTIVFSSDSSEVNLRENDFRGRKLGIIIKLDDEFDCKSVEKSYFNTTKYMPSNEELSELFKFIEDYFKQHTAMKILNLSQKDNLINLQNYGLNTIKKKYKVDYLCIVELSNLYFNFHNDIMTDEKYRSFIKISCLDSFVIKVFNPEYIIGFDMKLVPGEDTVTKTKYSYSALISYKLFDLSKKKLIYSKEKEGNYKTNVPYSKLRLIKRAIVDSLEESTLFKKDVRIKFFR